MKLITLEQLQELGACKETIVLFKRLYGDKVEVTEKACLKVALLFNWNWIAHMMLSASARIEYDQVHDLAWAKYKQINKPAWIEYKQTCAVAFAKLCNEQRSFI